MAALPVFLLLCLAATGLCEPVHKRIINGNHAEPGSHPFLVIVLNMFNSTYGNQCGGTLISREWVLTAAHCVMSSNNTSVFMGIHNIADVSNVNKQIVRVDDAIIHPGFTLHKTGGYNDLALLKLSTPASLNNNVKIASLAEQEDAFLGEKCVVAGWGKTSAGTASERLKEVELNVISMTICKTLLDCAEEDQADVTEKQICVHDATPPQGSRPSVCSGDSGGPMMCGSGHNVIAGVASWVVDCSGDYPAIYTRVSAYRDWIYQHARV